MVADSFLFSDPFPSSSWVSLLICLLQPCDPLSCASPVSLLPLFLSPCCSLFVRPRLTFSQPLAYHFSPSISLALSFCLARLDKLSLLQMVVLLMSVESYEHLLWTNRRCFTVFPTHKCFFFLSLPLCPLAISGRHPLSYLASLPLPQPLCHAVGHFNKNRKRFLPAALSFLYNNAHVANICRKWFASCSDTIREPLADSCFGHTLHAEFLQL